MLKIIRSLLLLSFLAAGTAFAADRAFDQAVFDNLRKQGKPVLVAIHADWCPTCKAQEMIVGELLKTPELRAITALRVDFDNQKAAVRDFKVQHQSTLIVFKGYQEVGRSTGDSNKERIAVLLRKAI